MLLCFILVTQNIVVFFSWCLFLFFSRRVGIDRRGLCGILCGMRTGKDRKARRGRYYEEGV